MTKTAIILCIVAIYITFLGLYQILKNPFKPVKSKKYLGNVILYASMVVLIPFNFFLVYYGEVAWDAEVYNCIKLGLSGTHVKECMSKYGQKVEILY